jgi:hypothetical protein
VKAGKALLSEAGDDEARGATGSARPRALRPRLVLYIGVLPLAGVCAIRAVQAVAIERKPLASLWYDLTLGAAALLAAATGVLALHVIHAHGGFYMPAPAAQFAQSGMTVVHNLGINLAAYVISTKANGVTQTHEIAAVLPFSAALAGRLLAGQRTRLSSGPSRAD